MDYSQWLIEHDFILVKEYRSGDIVFKTYQKIYENDDFLEIELTTYIDLDVTTLNDAELFCKNKNNTHDSITLGKFY